MQISQKTHLNRKAKVIHFSITFMSIKAGAYFWTHLSHMLCRVQQQGFLNSIWDVKNENLMKQLIPVAIICLRNEEKQYL